MDPLTSEEIDRIIAELLADEGPPLLVRFNDGHTRPAGQDRPSLRTYGPWAQKANNPPSWDDPAEIRRRLVEQVAAVQAKLAGDVFHEDLERMDLRTAARQALKNLNEANRKERADQAIHKAVHGQSE